MAIYIYIEKLLRNVVFTIHYLIKDEKKERKKELSEAFDIISGQEPGPSLSPPSIGGSQTEIGK